MKLCTSCVHFVAAARSVRNSATRGLSWVALFLSCTLSAQANLVPVVQATGKISVSVDSQGNNNAGGGTLRVTKPAGATVRGAFLMAASNSNRTIADRDVSLAGIPVTWSKAVYSNAGTRANFYHNVFADVTGMLKQALDIAPVGLLGINVTEVGTRTIDGTILVVIFDDPNQATDSSILLLFGGQNTFGDAFNITLSRPLGTTNSTPVATMGLGISFGFQGTAGTGMISHVDVNGTRLTSSAGGEDDGAGADGALITVGGIGDSISNPPPFAPSTGFRTDDELYDLRSFVAPGAKSISIRTFNPSNDDNILFAYFVTSEPAAIVPPVPAPGARTIVGTIDPALPTVVLTHGLQKQGTDIATLWTGSSNRQASSLITNALGTQRANIVQYIWEEAFQPFGCFVGAPNDDAYIAAQQNVVDAGLRLASELRRALGPNYNKQIHFIGHSLGTAVNTYAATALLDQLPRVTSVQFTALDRPHHVTKICGMTDSEERIYGFNSDFFAMNLPLSRPGLSLKIDNYYSLDGFGVGDIANGPVYNHPPLVDSNRLDDPVFGDESSPAPDNSHTGVQQWYRWTIAPNHPFPSGGTVCIGGIFDRPPSPSIGQALNPCRRGWYWSLLSNPSAFPANNGSPVSRTTAVLLRLTDPREFGCTISSTDTNTTVSCNEASSPFTIATVTIPEDAKFLRFNYTFTNSGDGDYVVVFLDGIPIWKLSGSSVIIGTSMDSGAIPIDGFIGRHDLMVALFGVGQPNFGFSMSDFRVVMVSPNNPPTITPMAQTVAKGSSVSNLKIATVNDAEDAKNTLAVSISSDGVNFDSSATLNGVTLNSTSVDASGNVKTTITTAANATNATFTLKVTDSGGLVATTILNITAVTYTGSISDPLACLGPGNISTGTIQLSNPAPFAQGFTLSTTFTNYAGVPGSCTLTNAAAGSTCTVTAGELSASGSIPANTTMMVQYLAQVLDQPNGATVTASNVATLGGGTVLPSPLVFKETLNCPLVGPGIPPSTTAPVNDQRPGSVLIYNIYTSSTDPNRQNTRISLTNIHPALRAYVHMFFVDGSTCAVADFFVCLTPNQTTSFLASDLDPGTTGYIVAVAVDANGCPTDFNYLIGDEYVKFASGHAANLGAEAITAIAGGLPFCNANSTTAVLSFDGVSYSPLPRALALDNIGSRGDGNDTLLIVNRIGGNLATGAATLTGIFGIFYDDAESAVSFGFSPGTCQLRSSISNNFPRITPRFDTFVPPGRTGWIRLYSSQNDQGILGAAINFNPGVAASSGAFNQGHNLHKLTLTPNMVLTIPIFPPSC